MSINAENQRESESKSAESASASEGAGGDSERLMSLAGWVRLHDARFTENEYTMRRWEQEGWSVEPVYYFRAALAEPRHD